MTDRDMEDTQQMPGNRKRYTKTQMRMSSFPAWEQPDFPSPDFPEVNLEVHGGLETEVAVADVAVAEPAEAPPAEAEETPVVTPIYRPAGARKSPPWDALLRAMTAYDPWGEEAGPTGWSDWFRTHCRPGRLLARLRLSYFDGLDRAIEDLIDRYTPAELEEAGLPTTRDGLQELKRCVCYPCVQRGEVLWYEARAIEGNVLMQTPREAVRALVFNRDVLRDTNEGERVTVTDHFAWMLRELSFGRSAVCVENVKHLPEWWPQDFSKHRVELLFRDEGEGGSKTKHLLRRFSAWGVEANVLSEETFANRQLAPQLAAEAATPARPGYGGVLQRLRDMWNGGFSRRKRPGRGAS